MRAVVDTNVVAYLVLGTAGFAPEARACIDSLTEMAAPVHWEAELTNVLWLAVRAGVLSAVDAAEHLAAARRLGIESAPTTAALCQGALLRSAASGVAVYDTLFVELALQLECPLVTFDKGLLRAFPKVAYRPATVRAPGARS